MRNGIPERRSGRVLLVDQERRLLLFRAVESLRDGGQRIIWFPVGGGAEGDESFVQCASRELFEETGLRVAPEDFGPIVAVRQGSFWFMGTEIWSNEAYFFLPTSSLDVDISGFTDLERDVVTGHRWWPIQELRRTDEMVFPPAAEMAALLEQLLASGAVTDPVQFSW